MNPHFWAVIPAALILVLAYHQRMFQNIRILDQLNSRMYFLLYQSTAALSIYTPPWLDDSSRFWSYEDTDPFEIDYRVVSGFSKPPEQYIFAFVPRHTKVSKLENTTLTESPFSTPKLSPSFNLIKGIASILQLLYTLSTLFPTNGGQLKHYGYVAPDLTVLPYAAMSLLNLIANLITPQYRTLYLVRSEVMEEAERRAGSQFHYVVGQIVDESGIDDDGPSESEIVGSFKDDDKVLYVTPSEPAEKEMKIEISDGSSQTIFLPSCPRFRRTDGNRYMTRRSRIISRVNEILLITTVFSVEILIALALSKFSAQQSTLTQRKWIVLWVITGHYIGILTSRWSYYRVTLHRNGGKDHRLWRIFGYLAIVAVTSVPAFAGFVVVSQMLIAYGICYDYV